MSGDDAILGIDIGSVAVGMVLIDAGGKILHDGYAFHRGDIRRTVGSLLAEVDPAQIRHVAATTSTPRTIRAAKRFYNEIAVITAARRRHPGMTALLHVGGEKFSLARFDEKGHYLGSRTNSSCAAGTGSFLDQQAGRLQLQGIEQLSEIAERCTTTCPQIATRCAVFAKTDLIHAQQEGYQVDEISNGLCQGLAKNITDTLFSADHVSGQIVFCGGVARNRAVTRHIEALTGLRLTVPAKGHLYGALGAALCLREELNSAKSPTNVTLPRSYDNIDDFFSTATTGEKRYYYPPLRLTRSTYPDFTSEERYLTQLSDEAPSVEVDLYRPLTAGQRIAVYLGIDIGSTSTKAVLLDNEHEVIAGFYTRTAGRPVLAVQNIFSAIDRLQQQKGVAFAIAQCGTTGSGRKFIGKLIGADQIIDEITAHARAAFQLNPAVDTIIEIGGQDAKFTTMSHGRVTFSTMNNVCAAGTGSFIEEQAAKLGCPIDDYSNRAENVRAPMTSDRCTVFMERDINHFLSEGYSVDEVLAAALHSVRENYLLKVATEKHIGQTIFFQGATAKNKALVAAFEQRLQRPILVSKFCHLTGALGTALILQDERRRQTSFVGLDLHTKTIPITSEICQHCNNHCKISLAEIDGQKVAYGFLCGRDYHDPGFVRRKTEAFDLLEERKRLIRFAPRTTSSELTIGLPAAVHLVDDLLLWQTFFDQLGIATRTSDLYPQAVKEGKKLSQAEFCTPICAMHGHVRWLLDQTDYVFLPLYLENKAREARRQFCYYTQFLPALAGGVAEREEGRILRPVLRYLYTPFHTKMQLYRMLQKLKPGRWSFFEVGAAYDRAIQVDQRNRQNLRELFANRWRQRKSGDIAVVFVGRPYTLFSPSLNCNIPKIFNNLGIDCYYQDMLDSHPDTASALSPLLGELHWHHAAKIIEATEIVATSEDLYPVLLTSFKCSPDSFAGEYFKAIMDRHAKPYLILELDEHGSNVGYETRIEAAIRSFRNHRAKRTTALPIDYRTINPHHAETLRGKYVVFPNWDRITCRLLTATLQREGIDAHLLEETDQTIRESLKHNSGQCIPLNTIAQGYIDHIRNNRLNPADCVLWLNRSTIACNIRLYPHHIRRLLVEQGGGLQDATVYQGDLSLADISLRAAKNGYFAYLLGGMLRRIACRLRPYERQLGETDQVLDLAVEVLAEAFGGEGSIERSLEAIVSRFEAIDIHRTERPKVAIFGDLYCRDNRVMNQDLIRFIEANGGEVVTTPYSEYAKIIAGSYFRKWFKEGKYLNMLTYRALLAAMTALEKSYLRIINRLLGDQEQNYDDDPRDILAQYGIAPENTGESMDNILKIHYLKKFHPELSLLVQASPALCCASLITEAMKKKIEKLTGIPVVSVTYDGTGGFKNEIIVPYLKYPRTTARPDRRKVAAESAF